MISDHILLRIIKFGFLPCLLIFGKLAHVFWEIFLKFLVKVGSHSFFGWEANFEKTQGQKKIISSQNCDQMAWHRGWNTKKHWSLCIRIRCSKICLFAPSLWRKIISITFETKFNSWKLYRVGDRAKDLGIHHKFSVFVIFILLN